MNLRLGFLGLGMGKLSYVLGFLAVSVAEYSGALGFGLWIEGW